MFKDEYRGIMHIGSTSIDGLDSKPIIDISIGLGCLSEFDYYKKKLAPILYKTDAWCFDNQWALFEKQGLNIDYHLHIMPYDSMRLFKQVLFKIYLEENREVAELYVKKKKYYATYDEDIWYSMNKLPFVQEVETTALIELRKNPQYWKERVYEIMGYVPHKEFF